jgi:competence protein ComEC
MRRLAWQLATLTVVWAYVVMIGAGAPAFRAGLVTTLAIVALRVGRKPDFLTIALIVAAVQVLIRPQDAGSLSYRLSTAAALGLLLVLGPDRPSSAPRWVWRTVVATLAANLATAPVVLAEFGLQYPLRSVIANVAIAPLIDLLFPLSMVTALAGAVWAPAAEPLSPLVETLSRACLGIVRLCARISGPTVRTETVMVGDWVWLALIVALFCVASREVRGGIARLARQWGTLAPADGFGAIALLAFAGAGALVAWLSR